MWLLHSLGNPKGSWLSIFLLIFFSFFTHTMKWRNTSNRMVMYLVAMIPIPLSWPPSGSTYMEETCCLGNSHYNFAFCHLYSCISQLFVVLGVMFTSKDFQCASRWTQATQSPPSHPISLHSPQKGGLFCSFPSWKHSRMKSGQANSTCGTSHPVCWGMTKGWICIAVGKTAAAIQNKYNNSATWQLFSSCFLARLEFKLGSFSTHFRDQTVPM